MIDTQQVAVVTPADFVSGPAQGFWTYDAYAALPDDGRRYEIMDGVLLMPPAPTPDHQIAATKFAAYLVQCMDKTGLGVVLSAPLDVELAPNRVVQPDVSVFLRESLYKIGEKKVVGAPDLIVEIASPSTAAYDRLDKYRAYAEAGVREYWLANPVAKSVEVLVLQGSVYQSRGHFAGEDSLPSQVVPGISDVQVKRFFTF